MNPSVAELFHGWHDFFLLLGTASATLVGLMFIAVSIGASIFKEENRPALEVFLGPTVVHFAAALVFCILALVPLHGWLSLACLELLAPATLPRRFMVVHGGTRKHCSLVWQKNLRFGVTF